MQAAPTAEEIRALVIAGHGDLARVQELLAAMPPLLEAAHEWGPGDTETALQGAAHVGNAPIAEYLLAQGAPSDICTAAMLGRHDEVRRLLDSRPESAQATGAHGIPLLAHAAFSGDTGLVSELYERGARDGAEMALTNAVSRGHTELARWLLEHASPDLSWQDFRGQTALDVAVSSGADELAQLLRERGDRVTRLGAADNRMGAELET
jgi:uncharacterized protein